MTKHLVWDMDGTLIDTSTVVPSALQQSIEELGGRAVAISDIVAAYSLGVPEVIVAHFLRRDVSPADMEGYYRRLQRVSVAPYAGIRLAVEKLRSEQRPIAVFTGASTRAANLLCAAAQITPDILVGSDKITEPKPSPEGLIHVAAILQCRVQDIAYVGDSINDIKAAQSAGCKSIAASWGHLYDSSYSPDFIAKRPIDALDILDVTTVY